MDQQPAFQQSFRSGSIADSRLRDGQVDGHLRCLREDRQDPDGSLVSNIRKAMYLFISLYTAVGFGPRLHGLDVAIDDRGLLFHGRHGDCRRACRGTLWI